MRPCAGPHRTPSSTARSTGYGSADTVLRALAGAHLAVLARTDGSPVTAATAEGTAVVPVFTARPHLDAMGTLAHEVMPCSDLVDRLPAGHALHLNPAGPAPMTVHVEPLLAVLATVAPPPAEEGPVGNGTPVVPRDGTGSPGRRPPHPLAEEAESVADRADAPANAT
ncbi:SseB family protein [Streptomyces griseoviridis]|uniref:SseB protein N-terminal domain-containing protein n=1 Tax=Streptomyces griseoviridis TaxID=45398 RepID=A0A918GWF6_STRGD|nr:SseB family protein [Streptomyces niveoruber]GGS70277.1 hypothetical protein GCM10010238_68360 [Streptomyces niveoruber]